MNKLYTFSIHIYIYIIILYSRLFIVFNFRYFVLYNIPYLKFLDSTRVTEEERREGRKRGKFMNIIRPKLANVNDVPLNTTYSNKFTPLPRTLRNPEDHRGSKDYCRPLYHSNIAWCKLCF